MQGKTRGLCKNQGVDDGSPAPGHQEMAQVGCVYAQVLTHLPDGKYTFKEEMGFGVLITSCHFQNLIW